MAVATNTIEIDGQIYKPGDILPDLGSLECVGTNGNQRAYFGFIEDKDKLPKYDNLGTGSNATLVDKNKVEETIVLKYHSLTKEWYQL